MPGLRVQGVVLACQAMVALCLSRQKVDTDDDSVIGDIDEDDDTDYDDVRTVDVAIWEITKASNNLANVRTANMHCCLLPK